MVESDLWRNPLNFDSFSQIGKMENGKNVGIIERSKMKKFLRMINQIANLKKHEGTSGEKWVTVNQGLKHAMERFDVSKR